jgi:NTP pyrophosphatase (non-canonical NTP hydrolase)|tara:strand:- start:187 stop:594 length:408 start_codon:yes stop_codon:yes gene_type:complete
MNLNEYKNFVEKVTSKESNDLTNLKRRMERLESDEKTPVNVALLLTAGTGLGSEGGEFNEIIKKMLFQGKPWNDEVKFHLKRELGDIMWYWISACRALNLDPNEVIKENVKKLSDRYPEGQFDMHFSENRKDGDL